MIKNGSKMVQKRSKMIKNGPKWSKMVQNDLIWFKKYISTIKFHKNHWKLSFSMVFIDFYTTLIDISKIEFLYY